MMRKLLILLHIVSLLMSKEAYAKIDVKPFPTKRSQVEVIKFTTGNLYAEYSLYQTTHKSSFSEYVVKEGSHFFTPSFFTLIKKDYDCTKNGYICWIDTDVLYNSQDSNYDPRIKFLEVINTNVKIKTPKGNVVTLRYVCTDTCRVDDVINKGMPSLKALLKED